jgi:hypothetical protein
MNPQKLALLADKGKLFQSREAQLYAKEIMDPLAFKRTVSEEKLDNRKSWVAKVKDLVKK